MSTVIPIARPSRWRYLVTVALAIVIAVGGGNARSELHRLATELVGIPVLLASFWRTNVRDFWRSDRAAAIIITGTILLFLLQVFPLPAVLWSSLPGRELAAQGDRLMFGLLPRRPLTLDPDATVRAGLMLLPPFGFYVLARAYDDVGRARLVLTIVSAAFGSLTLALLQVAAGHAEWSHLYRNSQGDLPTGIFANRNHQAMLMVIAIPLLGSVVACSARFDQLAIEARVSTGCLRLGAFCGGAAVLVAGELITGSRTGTALLLPAMGGGIIIALNIRLREWRRLSLHALWLASTAGMLAAAIAMGGGPLTKIAGRLNVGDEGRLLFWPQVAAVARAYLPFGSGIGTFRAVYDAAEPLRLVSPLYLNHAHNDWLEIVLEGGLPAGALLFAFSGWFMVAAGKAIRAGEARPRAAAVAVFCLLVHSGVDYPLRTVALATSFAVCLALLTPHGARFIRPLPPSTERH